MNARDFIGLLAEHGITMFCGVPDSLLSSFSAYVMDHTDSAAHTITANEGNAIAMAAGHYLATGNPGCVYMQNSGLGNCVNPLLSLTDADVYRIPVFLLIGWRGEPGVHDEPQHITQGKVTADLLDAMRIPHLVLPKTMEEAGPLLHEGLARMRENNIPLACLVHKSTFEPYTLAHKRRDTATLSREDAIECILAHARDSDIFVTTTGKISREVYELRVRHGQSHKQDFLTVGSMGHASSIAAGIALAKPSAHVICLDGDGAFLMHMGSAVVAAAKDELNITHIVLNNRSHDSVGGQPTAFQAGKTSIALIAEACGYTASFSASTKEVLTELLPDVLTRRGRILLEIIVQGGARPDLGRPKEKPVENKVRFMEHLACQ